MNHTSEKLGERERERERNEVDTNATTGGVSEGEGREEVMGIVIMGARGVKGKERGRDWQMDE